MSGEGESKMSDGSPTPDELTIMTLNQLKAALQVESEARHDLSLRHSEAQLAIELLREQNAELAAALMQREAELDLESVRLQITVKASCNPGSPSVLVRALTELLPEPLCDTLQLTCCIRTGETWTVIAADRGDEHVSIKTAGLDEAARVVKPESPVALLSLVPRETVKRMVYHVNGGESAEGGLDDLLEDSCLVSAFSRCLWLVTPQARLVGRATQAAHEAATFLAQQIQPALETASQLAMAALVQQRENEQATARADEGWALYNRVHSVIAKLEADLEALRISNAAAAQREELETRALQRLKSRVLEIEASGAGDADADGEAVGGSDDGVRVRKALATTLQGFVATTYAPPLPEEAVGEHRDRDGAVRLVVCQLVLSESVTEEGEARRWLLQPSGDWASFSPAPASTSYASGTSSSSSGSAAALSLQLSSSREEQAVAASTHLMTVRGAHRVVQLYSEGCAPSGTPARGLDASLSVYAVIGWALMDPSTNTPVLAASSSALPPPAPSAVVEAAWVSLLAATFSKNRVRLLGGAVTGAGDGWDAGEASVRAVRAAALAGTKTPLQAYLGSRNFLEGLHSRTPGFALVPLRIHRGGNGGEGEGEEGVWDVTAMPPLSPASQSTPLPAQEQPPRRLPARLCDVVLRAAAARLPSNFNSASDDPTSSSSAAPSYSSLPAPLPASDVLVVAGGGGTGSALLALSGMGSSVLSHLTGNDSGVGLTLGLDTEEQQGALKSLGITRRSLVLLYLAPPSAVFQDEREGEETPGPRSLAGFLCVLRGHRLVAPCCFPLLLRLLDGATLPLRLARAIEAALVGGGDGARMLLSCSPASPLSQGDEVSRDPMAVRGGEEEWARGLPERLSRAWLACSRRDVSRGVAPRARCVRAASYVLSGLLPTPLSAASAFAVKDSEGRELQGPVIPDWRLVLTACSAADAVPPPSSLVEQEALLAACPAPVPGAGLVQAAASNNANSSSNNGGTSSSSGGADGSLLVSSGSVGGGGGGGGGGLEVGWEDRALPPSTLTSASGSTRGPARLLRLFVTVPRAWLRGLPISGDGAGGTGTATRRVVIASQLFWLEGLGAPVPAGVRVSLLRTASQAGGLLGSLLLAAAEKVLTVAALGSRVVSLRDRSKAQAHAVTLVRNVVLSGAKVARDCAAAAAAASASNNNNNHSNHSEGHQAGGPDAELARDLSALVASLEQSDAAMAEAHARHARATALHAQALTFGPAETGGAAADELSALMALPTEDSLLEGEDRWLHAAVEAAGEACSLLALAADQGSEARAEAAALRKRLASAKVTAKLTAQQARGFASEIARVLPAAAALKDLEAGVLPSSSSSSSSSSGDEVELSQLYADCVIEVAALGSRALTELLDLCCRVGLREEASQALARVCSPVTHPSLLEPDGGRVNWDAKGVVVVWADEAPPPSAPPPLLEVLSWDLLRTAWRRGLAVSGPSLAASPSGPGFPALGGVPEAHPHWALSGGGRFNVEYVPFPRAALVGAEVDAAAVTDAYPKFVVQYLAPSLTSGASAGMYPSEAAKAWVAKMGLARAWLEDLLCELPTPAVAHSLLPASASASASTAAQGPGTSAPHDVSSATRLVLRAAAQPLDPSQGQAAWANFSACAALFLSALLRADACLLLPDGEQQEQEQGQGQEEARQMWGTVGRFVEAAAGGSSRCDGGPIVLTAGQVRGLLEQTGGATLAPAEAAAAEEPLGPSLSDSVLGAATAGPRCSLVAPLSAAAAATACGGGGGVTWLAVVQSTRRLGQAERQQLHAACRALSLLASRRLDLWIPAALSEAAVVRDVFAHAAAVTQSLRKGQGQGQPQQQGETEAEAERVASVIRDELPALSWLRARGATLEAVDRSAVRLAVQWARGADTASAPSDAARSLGAWALVVSGGSVVVPVALFSRGEEDVGSSGGRGNGEAEGDGPCWALRLDLAPDSPALPALLRAETGPSSSSSSSDAVGAALQQLLWGVAEEARRCLLLARLAAQRGLARAAAQKTADAAAATATALGSLSHGLSAVQSLAPGSFAALAAALALSLGPSQAQAQAQAQGHIKGARLHWQQDEPTLAPGSPSATSSSSSSLPEGTPWLTSDVLRDDSDEAPAEADDLGRVLRLGHWAVRDSAAPRLSLDRALSAPAGSPPCTPDPSSPGLSRLWIDVSPSPSQQRGHRAVLELRVSTEAAASPATQSSLAALQHGVRAAVGAVMSVGGERSSTGAAERALSLARAQASALASCLGELCTEGRAPEGYVGPSCGYIGVMLRRVQAELARLPGVRGTRATCRDTIENVELYSAFVGISGGGAIPSSPDAAVPRGPLHGASSSPVTLSSPSSARGVSAGLGAPVSISVSSFNGSPSAHTNTNTNTNTPATRFTFVPEQSPVGVGGLQGQHGDWSSSSQAEPEGGSEFAFSCGEISGALVVYFQPQPQPHPLGLHLEGHEESAAGMLVALSRALARRVFELHRGFRNQQLMLRQQRSALSIKTELAARHELALELESAKSVALTQLQQAQEECEALRAQVRAEKSAAAEAVAAHKSLAKQLQRVSTDLKVESSRELAETKAEAHRAEATAAAEVARRDAIITVLRDDKKAGDKAKRELAVALEREKAVEKSKYELAVSCAELEALTVSQRAELRELQGALADCRRQIENFESDRRGTHDLVALLEQEKARADKLQAFIDLLKS